MSCCLSTPPRSVCHCAVAVLDNFNIRISGCSSCSSGLFGSLLLACPGELKEATTEWGRLDDSLYNVD